MSGRAARCNFEKLEGTILKDVFIVNKNNREAAQNEPCRSTDKKGVGQLGDPGAGESRI